MAWVKFVREDIEIEVEDGISVLEAEIQAGLRPDAPCGGLGKCGKCLVKINGEVVKACQVRIGEGETCIQAQIPLPQAIWNEFWLRY